MLNVTDKTNDDICVFWNECIFTDYDPPLPEMETLVCRPPPIPATVKQKPRKLDPNRNLNNTLKIVHITDIHVDDFYDVVSPE